MDGRHGQRGIDQTLVAELTERHRSERLPQLQKLWAYFRNAPEPAVAAGPLGPATAERRTRLAQERGLPARLTGAADPRIDDRQRTRREVVIENDIAWRVQAMVDFMFGKPLRIVSTAGDAPTRRKVEALLDAAWEASGGIALLQDMALLGHVYGYVDLLVRLDEPALQLAGRIAQGDADENDLIEIAHHVRIELIEPTRGIPIPSGEDYRRLAGYVVCVERPAAGGRRRFGRSARPSSTEITEIFTPGRRRLLRDGRQIDAEEPTLLGGELPIVHVQNLSQPFRYEGIGEVEPLIPLQDELNTRLSDRASRVTMQTFKMFLARGIDGFEQIAVGPGQIWSTDNPDASIETFGGDADSPSETAHIGEIREALDKISGVPPVASGVVRAKIGNLSSANALRVTLMGLISRTARKRVTYGRGIEQVCALILNAVDAAGVLRLDAADRGTRLAWPDPLPSDLRDEVAAARAKAELGVPTEQVLADLGYGPTDAGVT